ncbi:hypothetical protein YB2330_002718 [Saitoella coloradoensis]
MARCFMYPRSTWTALLTDSQETPYLSAAVIGYTTIVAMVGLVCAEAWGHSWGIVAYVLWWIAVFFTIVECVAIPYIIIRWHSDATKELTNQITPVLFLIPIAPLTTAAVGGALCLSANWTTRMQVPVIIFSFQMLGLGLLLALALDAIYLGRLFNNRMPPQNKAPMSVIVIGPLGQASFAFLNLGIAVSRGAFAGYNKGTFLVQGVQEAVFATCVLTALCLLGFSILWGAIAFLEVLQDSLQQCGGQRLGYSIAWWSSVFPIAVNTTALIQLANVMDSPTFRTLSAALCILIVILWFGNAFFTILGLVKGDLLGLQKGWKGTYIVGDKKEDVESENGPRVNDYGVPADAENQA